MKVLWILINGKCAIKMESIYIFFHVLRVIVIDLGIAGFSYCHWNAYHANFKTITCILEFDLWLIAQLLQKINFDL